MKNQISNLYLVKFLFCINFIYITSMHLSAHNVNIDSLICLLPSLPEDKSKLTVLYEITVQLNNQFPKKAIPYADSTIVLAERLGNERAIASTLNSKGVSYYYLSDYETAIKFFLDSQSKFRTLGDSTMVHLTNNNIAAIYIEYSEYEKALKYVNKAHAYFSIHKGNDDKLVYSKRHLGLIYDYFGDYYKSLQYHFESLELARNREDEREIAICLRNIGMIYSLIHNYPLAYKYYQEALIIFKSLNWLDEEASIYQNIALLFDYQEQNDSALYYHYKSLVLDTLVGNITSIADDYNNIGVIYEKMDSNELAEESYLKALALKREVKNKERIVSGLTNIGDFYLKKQGNPSKAYPFIEEGYIIAKKIKSMERLKDISKLMAEYYEQVGDFKLALLHFENYKSYADTLFNTDRASKILNLTIDEQRKQSNLKIELLNMRIAREKMKQRNLFISLSLVVLLFIYSLYQGIKNRKKYNRQKLDLEEKNSKILIALKRFEKDEITSEQLNEEAIILDRGRQIPLKDIQHIEANGELSLFHTADATFTDTRLLKIWQEELEKTGNFLRIHKSHIINLTKIDSRLPYDKIKMENGLIIPIGRKYRDKLSMINKS